MGEKCEKFYTGEIENFTKNRHIIIFIVDLIVQRSIMKKSPKKRFKRLTREQVEKMSFREFTQTLDDLDKKTKVGIAKISWWNDEE